MIKLVTPSQIDSFKSFCGCDPFGCKLYSLITAYGTEELFAQFWLCYDDATSVVTAALGKLEGTLTICAPQGIPEDVHIFAKMLADINCIESGASGLSSRSGTVMRLNSSCLECTKEVRLNSGIYGIYQILSTCDAAFAHAALDAVYVDIHRRIQCGVMQTSVLYKGEKPCACAVASLSQGAALISSVACVPEERGQGLASQAVAALLSSIERDNIYLFCRDELIPFYQRLGFTSIGGYFENEARFFCPKP
ncbi:MAG: GNAT family N-acetyltransferase [Oscillospiraceae bacterium]|jgi:N-acetylglutamate synthase-like GNAT family acetyltransferase|nr:GNAT family N-acetyltransferase [Oscillospiraceae bacterium]